MSLVFEGERVRVLADGSYREVRLARPEKRNALDVRMRDELYDALLDVLEDPRVTVGVLGEGPDFCGGGDLDEFGTRADAATAHQIRLVRPLASLFAAVGGRMVVGIHGAAVGAGVELSAFARTIVARPDARFLLPEATFGLLPGSGGTVSITRRIGRRRTFELALSREWLPAERALEWRLVDAIVEGDLAREVRARAAERHADRLAPREPS